MKKYCISLLLIVGSVSPLLAVGSAGFTNQVLGSKAFAMGNAFTALADDPSAVFFNPAGLTQLSYPSVSVGMAPIIVNTEYQPNTGSADNTDKFLPIVPNFYAAAPYNTGGGHAWAFGFGVNSPFGLESHWSDTGPLRYVATDAELKLANMNPTVAYQVNDGFSLGAGIVYGFVETTLESRTNISAINTALNGTPTTSPDGGGKFSGTGDGWGYNFGALVKPGEKHSFGLSYRSVVKTRIKGETELNGLTGTAATTFGGSTYRVDAHTDFTFPQTLMIGYAYKPGNWVLEIDGEWVDYSTIDNTNFTFLGESNATRLSLLNANNPTNRDWHNAWNLGLGANYNVNETWQVRGGYFHYPRVIPTATWDPVISESSKNGLTTGASFSRPSFTIDMTYGFVLFDDRTVNNSVGAGSLANVNGTYKTSVHVLSFNFTHRFGA